MVHSFRCYDTAGAKNGLKGPMDPTKKEVYKFLEEFFEEISQVFPDKYLHLGGDEVDFSCWCVSPMSLSLYNRVLVAYDHWTLVQVGPE